MFNFLILALLIALISVVIYLKFSLKGHKSEKENEYWEEIKKREIDKFNKNL